MDSASSFLMTAQSLPLKQAADAALMKTLEQEEKRVQGVIDNAGKTAKFAEKLQLVDTFIKKEDLAGAKKELTAATELAVEDSTLKTFQEKQKLLAFLSTAEIKRKAFVEILNRAADTLKKPENVTDEAMKALSDAQSKLPSDDDKARLQREAPYLIPSADEFNKMQKKFAAILDDRQKVEHYDRLMKQVKETTDNEKKATLLQEAIDIGLDRNEAKTAKIDIDNQLGAKSKPRAKPSASRKSRTSSRPRLAKPSRSWKSRITTRLKSRWPRRWRRSRRSRREEPREDAQRRDRGQEEARRILQPAQGRVRRARRQRNGQRRNESRRRAQILR